MCKKAASLVNETAFFMKNTEGCLHLKYFTFLLYFTFKNGIIGFMSQSKHVLNSRREYMFIEKINHALPQSRRDYM